MDQITINMEKFMKDHPKLKYIFFGGKGGVGKTVMAGAAALWSAKQGKKTLLASTNPVHSLSNLLKKMSLEKRPSSATNRDVMPLRSIHEIRSNVQNEKSARRSTGF